MAEIDRALLAEEQNKWIGAERAEPVRAVLQRVGSRPGWHVIVAWGDGQYRAIGVRDLMAQEAADAPGKTMGECALLIVPVRERTALGTGAALAVARRSPSQMVVVTEGGRPIGLIFVGATLSGATAAPDLMGDAVTIGGDVVMGDAVTIGGDIMMGDPGLDSSSPGDPGPLEQAPPAAPFEAQPGLEAPERVLPGATFTVTVGLRAERDRALTNVSAIRVTPATPDDSFTVTLLTDGAELVDGKAQRELPLRLGASVTFECRALPGMTEISLTAEFVYQWQVAGTATRRVWVSADPAAAPPPPVVSDPCRMSLPAAEAQTDIVLTITRAKAQPGTLQWTLLAPHPPLNIGPLTTQLSDAREFAAQIITELRTQQYRGPFAAQILENKAQDIADIMPAEFFDALRQVFAEIGRAPTLLLLTDETFVPWELALIDPPLDATRPPYLGAQTVMGRWLRHEKVQSPPPWTLMIDHLTAVAAGFGLGTNLPELAFALDEQQLLATTYQARVLGATLVELAPLVTEPRRPGHLIHFAVHGKSEPQANDQGLLLADNNQLTPSALAGRYRCGETPNFAFVFLNACQVGTGGGSLGQAAGFPGDLIRGGVQGFVAPLWNVDDQAALGFAERFYAAALAQGQPLGEVLLAERQRYDPNDTTTPMAYIYYGHPLLKLDHRTAVVSGPPASTEP